MKNNTKFIPIALSYVGAFVGAGFISGQELSQFVIKFGLKGWLVWLFIVLTISAAGGFFLSWLSKKKYKSFDELVRMNFSKKMVWLINMVINGYLVGGLVIMVSGASTLLSQVSGSPMIEAVVLISALIAAVVFGEGKRVLKVNTFLVPILMVLTLAVSFSIVSENIRGIRLISDVIIKNPSPLLVNPVVSYLLYIGYNAIGAMVALLNIASETNEKDGLRGGFWGGIIISILGSMILLAMWLTYPSWNNFDLPFTEIVRNRSSLMYIIFVPSIFIAMFTVAVAYALGITRFLMAKFNSKIRITTFVVMLIVSPAAVFGFSKLLGIIYPIFGILATLIVVYILFIKLKGKLYANKIL